MARIALTIAGAIVGGVISVFTAGAAVPWEVAAMQGAMAGAGCGNVVGGISPLVDIPGEGVAVEPKHCVREN